MSQVKRVYVEKKPDYAVKAKELLSELRSYLSLGGLTGVRLLIRYDVENVSEETWQMALGTVFSEPPVDSLYEGTFPREEDDRVFISGLGIILVEPLRHSIDGLFNLLVGNKEFEGFVVQCDFVFHRFLILFCCKISKKHTKSM